MTEGRQLIPEQRQGPGIQGLFESDLPLERQRDICLSFISDFESVSDARCTVWATGLPWFPSGRGRRYGKLHVARNDLAGTIDELNLAWRRFIERIDPGTGSRVVVENLDLSDASSRQELNQRLLTLARAGRKVFRMLFFSEWADDQLKYIGGRLEQALADGNRLITIESDVVFVPWSLLYVGSDPLRSPEDPRFFEGFLGYSHRVDHTLPYKLDIEWSPRVSCERRVRIDSYVDKHLDEEFKDSPPVTPVMESLQQLAQLRIQYERADLERDLLDPLVTRSVVYVGCHGSDPDGSTSPLPYIILSDRIPVTMTDIHDWLMHRHLNGFPMVFINTCMGGQLSSQFHSTVGRAFLEKGATTLIGPHIEIPPLFATDYAIRFFRVALSRGVYIGDVTRQLARYYVDRYNNPLGLSYTLHSGLDAHFWYEDDSDETSLFGSLPS